MVNYKSSSSRQEYRARLQGQLDAIKNGTWPRDLNDIMFWDRPVGVVRGRTWVEGTGPRDWAQLMCEENLAYVDGLEKRLAEGAPELKGWEGWVDSMSQS